MDKFDRLLHAVDRPDKLTKDELLAMLSDPELMEAYNILVDTKSALYPQQEVDVDKEWDRFSRKMSPAKSPISFFTRYSAAVIVAGILALGATGTVIGITLSKSMDKATPINAPEQDLCIEKATASTSFDVRSDSLIAKKSDIVTFENKPLSEILAEISRYYNVKITYVSDTSKKLRLFFKWDRSLSADEVIRLLNNFDHISISISEKVITVK